LLTNLLDQARAEAQQTPRAPQPIDPAQVWINLQNAAHGLACYHTDPPVPFRWQSDDMPARVVLDAEQIERAVLNLLDNALTHSPPHGMITVRAHVVNGTRQIEVQDDRPGLPAAVCAALTSGTPAPCLRLGLQQVQRTVAAHNGHIMVATNAHGTTIASCCQHTHEPAHCALARRRGCRPAVGGACAAQARLDRAWGAHHR
jgi:signal transduction histidine kinase